MRYGTILVDLDTHRVVDLLPDRSKASATAWFQAHPQIELVSRDRGADYAAAAREGAPQARQVADRWHLLHNLSEVVIEMLTRHLPQIRKASRALVAPSTPEPEQGPPKEPTPAGDEEPLPLRLGRPYREPRVLQAELARRAARYDCDLAGGGAAGASLDPGRNCPAGGGERADRAPLAEPRQF